MRKKVLVVGGGLAGIISAASARNSGAEVIMVTSGPGTLAMSGASINIEGMDLNHPCLEKAMIFFRDMTVQAGCEYCGEPLGRQLIPNVMGKFQEVSMAPASIWSGIPLKGTKVLVLGIRGLTGFSSYLIAEALNDAAAERNLQAAYTAGLIEVPWLYNRCFSTMDLANLIEEQQKRDILAEVIKPLVRDVHLLLMPAVLGQTTGDPEFARFSKLVGCPVGELSTVPPSVVGMRVYQALLKYLRKSGVEINFGYPVQALQVQAGRCTSAVLATPGRKRVIRAGSYIVATGRINSMGIAINNEDEPITGHLTGNITVNEKMQVLNQVGLPIAANIFSAGSILEGHSYRNGNAQAILSGYQAGMAAAGVKYHAR